VNFRRLFQLTLITQICMLAFAFVVAADEPLSMKIEMRHGPNGPKKAAIGVPGENLCFSVDIRGLKTSEHGEVEIQTQVEVRNGNNDLIKLLGNHEFELKRYLGKGRYWLPVTTSIPTDHEGGKVKLVVALRDRITDKQIKSEFPITIQKREGAYIANINFARGHIDTSASGRFEVGEVVIVRFHLLGLESTKNVNCALTIHPQGKGAPALELKMPIEVPQVIGIENGYVHGFQFAALEEFSGLVRLTVTDDAGHSNSVDMPLQVNPALCLDQTTFLAERPASEQKPNKKE
jgi:hypothetical protein